MGANQSYPVVDKQYKVIKRVSFSDNEKKSSWDWFKFIGTRCNVMDPDGWRHLHIGWDNVISFETFLEAMNGDNTLRVENNIHEYIKTNKDNGIWYVVSFRTRSSCERFFWW